MCPEGWISNGDYCYQLNIHPEQKLTWNAAKRACRAFKGADLISIESAFEQNLLTNRTRDTGAQQWGGYIWTGLNDISTEGLFSWSDNKQFAYKNWGFGREQLNSEDKDCVRSSVRMASGDWSAANCSDTNYYACKKKRGERSTFHRCFDLFSVI